MKTQNVNNKLTFDRLSVIELNDQQLLDVDGGATPAVVAAAAASSAGCAAVGGAIVGAAIAYFWA